MNQDRKDHETFLKLCDGYNRREAPMVVFLQNISASKYYRKFESSLFKYAVNVGGLSKNLAYSLIAIGKKGRLYPCLQKAIVERSLSISKAGRIVSIITQENAEELVEFAKNNTSEEIEREVRRRNPAIVRKASIKPLTGDTDLLHTPIPCETTKDIKRAQSLLAQRGSKHQGVSETISIVFNDYIERHDPVRKAERAVKRKSLKAIEAANKSREVSAHAEKPANSLQKRVPMTAEEIHAVNIRDKGQCTFVMPNGKRCCEDRWVDHHHIIRVADGGSNESENLTTLCSYHHDLVHQLVFPIDGAMSLLRSPQRPYA